jgi:hypothetical protein
MKQLLLGFLMLVMLTPSLVCAMPMCTDEALAAKAEVPCADHVDHHGDKNEGQSNKPTFMSDCAGVDMQKADLTSLEKPDLKSNSLVYVLTDASVLNNLSHTDVGSIRGPPPDWPALSQTHPSILLTTQRLRI